MPPLLNICIHVLSKHKCEYFIFYAFFTFLRRMFISATLFSSTVMGRVESRESVLGCGERGDVPTLCTVCECKVLLQELFITHLCIVYIYAHFV